MDDTAQTPTNLLVGLDGSRLAETVLPLVRAIARGLGARVTLLHVLEQAPPATIHGEPHLTTAAEAEAYLAGVAERLGAAGVPTTVHVHHNPEHDVVGSIAAHAAELNADLIVLCAHGAGDVRDWLVGRIPQQVLARAQRPVLIVPAPVSGDLARIRRILLPVDPAGEYASALPLAQRLALACGAEVVLATVVPTSGTLPGPAGAAGIFLPHTTASLLEIAEEEARQNLERLAATLEADGLAVSFEVRRGDAAHELAQAITAHTADLVVMATHARLGWDGLWSGSVAPRLFGAACPQLLVPIAAKPATQPAPPPAGDLPPTT